MKKKIIASFITVAMLGMTLLGCGGSKSDTIKIAFVGPLTGDCAEDGIAGQKGAEYAIEVLNENGGYDGKKYELVSYDDKADPKEAVTVATKLCQDQDNVAVVAHFNGSCLLGAAPIYEKNTIAAMSFGVSTNKVEDAGEYIFTDINLDYTSGKLCAEFAANDLGMKNVAVILENDDYGSGLAKSFESNAEELGVNITSEDSYLIGETKDFTSILTKIKSSNAEMIFVAGVYNETAMIAKQAKQLGIDLKILGTEGIYSPGLLNVGGDAVEGVYTVGTFHTGVEDAETQKFVEGYREYAGHDPSTFAASAYDVVMLIAKSIENGGSTDRKDIRNELAKISEYSGVSGKTKFDENGDAIKEGMKLIVKDGQFQFWSEEDEK